MITIIFNKDLQQISGVCCDIFPQRKEIGMKSIKYVYNFFKLYCQYSKNLVFPCLNNLIISWKITKDFHFSLSVHWNISIKYINTSELVQRNILYTVKNMLYMLTAKYSVSIFKEKNSALKAIVNNVCLPTDADNWGFQSSFKFLPHIIFVMFFAITKILYCLNTNLYCL